MFFSAQLSWSDNRRTRVADDEGHRRPASASPRRSCGERVEDLVVLAKALAEAGEHGVRDQHQFQQVVRRTVGRWVGTRIRRRPMIVPVVIEA
ncbi:hypothetical protein JSQ78_04485 [Agrococcus sp. Marseille-Q4369]|nr:hypothetical protein JSQ78_04485 [Agrococcus sp. Marseille-Q4369]